jgi:hypothetical protein
VLIDENIAKRPQYIVNVAPLTGPAIVVNRIVGSVGSGELRVGYIEEGRQFVGENHVNVILPTNGAQIPCERLLSLLSSPEIGDQIRLITGNTQVSATELNYMVRVSP